MSEKSKTVTCRQVDDLLDLLVANDLPEEQANHLLAHLDFCPACRAAYEHRRQFSTMLRDRLSAAAAQAGSADLWPRVRGKLAHRERRWRGIRWLQVEPVRALAAAAALTVGLYLLMVSYPSREPMREAGYPVYESIPVVITTASIDHQSARVSGFESSDGKTVFLWLEGVQ